MKLLFIYSSKDKLCLDSYKHIKSVEEIRRITTPLDASNETVHTIIKNSTNIKITELPAILVYGDGKVDKFEGSDSVSSYINDVISNIEETKETYSSTSISDLGLEEESAPEPQPQRTPIDQGPPRPNIQNMPIKNKRGGQSKKIDEFANRRTQQQPTENTGIKITSPKMDMPRR